MFHAVVKKCLCRRCLSLVLFLYFMMVILFIMNLDLNGSEQSQPDESFALISLTPTFQARLRAASDSIDSPTQEPRPSHFNQLLQNDRAPDVIDSSSRGGIHFRMQEPLPLLEPESEGLVNRSHSGDFFYVDTGFYAYSAFLDDRKDEVHVRILTLVSQTAATQAELICHFNSSGRIIAVNSKPYQLCENHNKPYGGYIYSCKVPHDHNVIRKVTSVAVSLSKSGNKINVPVLSVRPSKELIPFLNSYPLSPNIEDKLQKLVNELKHDVPSKFHDSRKFLTKIDDASTNPTLSFAICVSPLFGNISVHRLIEFLELSRLLGAHHVFFYNHSIPGDVSAALRYYADKKLVSVLPWTLPEEVGRAVWYFGQLLANNDCLYRSMANFHLVAFNDIDEFIVPHANISSWGEAFSSLLTPSRCGFSFQSAFYDPGIRESFESNLLTPLLTAKSQQFSKVRTKVMLCPWRVFEVGIHHISKQNRELWLPHQVPTSLAYLHHYRRCVSNFGMHCGLWQKDSIIADRYLDDLSRNYESALRLIGSFSEANGG